MSRKFSVKMSHQELAAKIADVITGKGTDGDDDFDYDPINDPDCWGKPRNTFNGNDVAFLKSANYAIYTGISTLTPQIEKDLGKVEFDTENVEWEPHEAYCEAGPISGFQTLPNGLTYLGITAGGDWENPIFFIIYFDGKELRAYIPKDGNTWNHKTKKAFGNADDEEEEEKEFKAQFGTTGDWRDGDQEGNVDCHKIRADIQGRIQFSGV